MDGFTGSLILYLSQFVTGLTLAFSSLWQLSLLTLAVLPVMAISGGFSAYILMGFSAKSREAYNSTAGKIALEVISQIRTVQSFTGERKALTSYSSALLSTKKLAIREGLARGFGIGSQYGLGHASIGFLLWFTGRLIRNGTTTGGEGFTTILMVMSSFLSLGQAAPDVAAISKAKVAVDKIFEMTRRKPKISINPDGSKLGQVTGNIELRNICFSYPSRPNINVFENFSLIIPAGKMVAIVGKSGAGKSTVISLIERFYDPRSGEVLLDGHDIKTMQLKWLRDQMGLVSQEPALFATTIRENIMYGKRDGASLEELMNAASVSHASAFIDALPDGYETQVGERGVQLSGGQKQRVAIARAILKNPPILLLDEATSALDLDSEKSVQKALDQAAIGRTTVIVAHRLSTIQNADIIAVVEDGRVAELGSHRELINMNNIYAGLLKIQSDSPSESRICEGPARGSLSQRTMSFRSSTGSLQMEANECGPKTGHMVGPRPSFKRITSFSAREWPFVVLAVLGAIVAGAQSPVFALIMIKALEYFYVGDMKEGLARVALYCLGIGTITFAAFTCEHYFSGIAGERITQRIRTAMFSAILRNEVGWFDLNSSNVLASRLSADASLVRGVVIDTMVLLLQNLSLVAVALIITFSIQWKLSLVMVITFPAVVGAFLGQMLFMKGFYGDSHVAYMKANAVAGDALANIRTVSAFSAEDKVISLFRKELKGLQNKAFMRGQTSGLGYGASQFVLFSWCALALWYGSVLIRKEDAQFGQTMKCFMVLLVTAFTIAETLAMAPSLMRSADTLQGIFQIIDRQTQIDVTDPVADDVQVMDGTIELRHISFSYPCRPDVQVLRNLNLQFRSGKRTAIVGSSGSGKSSIISLIARFYDPQAGRVLIDGKDIKNLRLDSLRQHMGMVQQEPALFSTNIHANICYGKEDATEAEVVQAAKAANAHSFISGLPNGYMTEVGERGFQLSGGQKQRVAIARAILRNPKILLLDEATSALDTESEKLVQEALEKAMQRRTTVLVAHRLSTVENSDSIAVLENGIIREQGSHHGLMARQGKYFQLYNLAG
ncbi:hypothetical protein KP509_18G065300 [Ceratopteris richardii]|uniref:Uncharacterized protein n=1 Tax=Ceratopteris richardii TaxID=49495 RepID=A0A8T2SU49_CERRI|nr:hypothetical protein KP509_18G065300 [Ceratopteris richardii]